MKRPPKPKAKPLPRGFFRQVAAALGVKVPPKPGEQLPLPRTEKGQ